MLKTFSGDGSSQTLLAGLEKRLTGRVPEDSTIPGPVRQAARLMLAGGGATLAVALFLIIAAIADKNALTAGGKKISDAEFNSSLVGNAITYLILVAIWVIMARMNRSGHNWARILASVFCAISTFDAYTLINSLRGGETITVVGIVYIVSTLVIWVLGVIAVALLWRAESGAYFKARSAAR